MKSFVFFILTLVAVWAGFVAVVIIFKSRMKNRPDPYDDFENRYKDLDELIEKKRKEKAKEK